MRSRAEFTHVPVDLLGIGGTGATARSASHLASHVTGVTSKQRRRLRRQRQQRQWAAHGGSVGLDRGVSAWGWAGVGGEGVWGGGDGDSIDDGGVDVLGGLDVVEGLTPSEVEGSRASTKCSNLITKLAVRRVRHSNMRPDRVAAAVLQRPMMR